MKGRITGREKDREEKDEESFHPLAHAPNSRNKSLPLGPKDLIRSIMLSQATSRELQQKWTAQDTNQLSWQRLILLCHDSTPRAHFYEIIFHFKSLKARSWNSCLLKNPFWWDFKFSKWNFPWCDTYLANLTSIDTRSQVAHMVQSICFYEKLTKTATKKCRGRFLCCLASIFCYQEYRKRASIMVQWHSLLCCISECWLLFCFSQISLLRCMEKQQRLTPQVLKRLKWNSCLLASCFSPAQRGMLQSCREWISRWKNLCCCFFKRDLARWRSS